MSKPRLLSGKRRRENPERERLLREFSQAREAALRLAEEGERLSPEERARLEALARRLADLREPFILANEGLVWRVAEKMTGIGGVSQEDLIQAGWEGLMRAVDRYDPRRARFSTFAVWHIMYAMQQAIAEAGNGPSASLGSLAKAHQARAVHDALAQELGRAPTPEEVAEVMGVRPSTVRRYLALAAPPAPLDALPLSARAVEDVEERVLSEERRALVREALACLDERERTILALRFGLGGQEGPLTINEVGRRFGISGERVRQIQAEALRRLRSAPEGQRLVGLLV